MSKIRSPLDPDQAGLISKDSHSALIQFTPEGTYKQAVRYIDKIVAAVERVGTRRIGAAPALEPAA